MPASVRALIVSTFILLASATHAADWTQWFGPNHDGVTEEKISAAWGSAGPKVLWRVPMGDGLGTMVVSGGKVYCLAQTEGLDPAAKPNGTVKGGSESIVCLDAENGKQLWAAPVGPTILQEHSGNDGPRSTPAVDGGLVYAVGTYLNIACFDAATGKPVWSHDCAAEYGAELQLKTAGIGAWGCSNSAVIDGNLLFVHCGGAGQALMAFDKKSGQVAWKTGDDELTHSTPTVGTILGQRQVIFFTKKGLVSLAPESGKILWRYPYQWNVSTAISPVICGDIVYCSAGYGVGGGACKISKEGETFKASEVWRVRGDKGPDNVASHWSTPVFYDGHLFGLIGFKEFGKEPLKCVDVASGKILWSQAGFGQGGTCVAGGKLLVLGDTGQLVLCDAAAGGYKELARFQAFQVDDPGKGKVKCWNQPIVSGGRIYARSTKECLCLDASAK